MKIKTSYNDCPYITAEKEYEVKELNNGTPIIIDDDGFKLAIKINNGKWLEGSEWEIMDGYL